MHTFLLPNHLAVWGSLEVTFVYCFSPGFGGIQERYHPPSRNKHTTKILHPKSRDRTTKLEGSWRTAGTTGSPMQKNPKHQVHSQRTSNPFPTLSCKFGTILLVFSKVIPLKVQNLFDDLLDASAVVRQASSSISSYHMRPGSKDNFHEQVETISESMSAVSKTFQDRVGRTPWDRMSRSVRP